MFIRLDKTQERDGQTDGQTNISALAISAVCTASNANNAL